MENNYSKYDFKNETKMTESDKGKTSIDDGTYETLRRNTPRGVRKCDTKCRMIVVGIISALVAAAVAVVITLLVSSKVNNEEVTGADGLQAMTTEGSSTYGKNIIKVTS